MSGATHGTVLTEEVSNDDSDHRLLRFNLIARAAILLAAGCTALLGYLTPTSLTATLGDGEGIAEAVVLLLMVGLVGVGLLDMFINDLLPERWRMRWAKRRRHMGFALLGAVYLVKAFAGVSFSAAPPGSWVLILFYVGMGCCCAWFTFASALRPTRAL